MILPLLSPFPPWSHSFMETRLEMVAISTHSPKYRNLTENSTSYLYLLAMIVYEYLITFDQEVLLFWRRKPTGATVLFLMVRYLALLSYSFFGAATYAPMSAQVRATFTNSVCGVHY